MNASLFYTLILTILFILNSCSTFLNLFKNEPDYQLKPEVQKQHYCEQKKKLNFAHQDKQKVKVFENIHQQIQKSHRLTFTESAVLWSLFQLAFSPNNTSPSARFQVVVGGTQKDQIFDFNTKDPRLKLDETFLDGLNHLLRKKKSNKSLFDLFNLAQKYFPQDVKVDKHLAEFIQHNKQNLKNNPHTKKHFFKAKNPLQPGESFRRVNFNSLKSLVKKRPSHNLPQAPLFPIDLPPEIGTGSEVECNMDLNLYGRSIYLLNRKTYSNNVFALYSDTGEYFLGITSFTPTWKPVKRSYLIESYQIAKPEVLCLIKNELSQKRTVVLSFSGRDPGQHIFHLIQYGLTSAIEDKEYFEFIKYPRHQFLLNPPRLTFESSRGTTKQLQSLLEFNFPVYNAYSLAQIWIFNQKPKASLITDDRNHIYQSCHLN